MAADDHSNSSNNTNNSGICNGATNNGELNNDINSDLPVTRRPRVHSVKLTVPESGGSRCTSPSPSPRDHIAPSQQNLVFTNNSSSGSNNMTGSSKASSYSTLPSQMETSSPVKISSPSLVFNNKNNINNNTVDDDEHVTVESAGSYTVKHLNPDDVTDDGEIDVADEPPILYNSPRGANRKSIEPSAHGSPAPSEGGNNLPAGKSPRNNKLNRNNSGNNNIFEKIQNNNMANGKSGATSGSGSGAGGSGNQNHFISSLNDVKKSINNGVSNLLSKLTGRKSIKKELPKFEEPVNQEDDGALRVVIPGVKTPVAIATVSVQQHQHAAAPKTVVDHHDGDDKVISQVHLKSNITITQTDKYISFMSPRFNVRYAKQGSMGKLTSVLGSSNGLHTMEAAAAPSPTSLHAPFAQGNASNMFLTPRIKPANKKKSIAQPGLATNVKLFQAVKDNDVDTVQQLLSESAEFERQNGDPLVDVNFHYSVEGKQTPIHIAAKQNNATIMELLASAGADVNAQDGLQRTPLHMATSLGAHECAILLLSHGAKLNVRDHYGNAPFHLSVRGHYFDIAHDFILFGADINFKRQDGCSSLHETMQRGDKEAFHFFIKLHEEGQRVLFNIKDEMGDTPFLRAVAYGKTEMVDELLKTAKVTKVHFLYDNAKGQNMFHIASSNGRARMMQHLIDKFEPIIGTEEITKLINTCDKTSGFSPLHCAAHNDCVEVMKLFQQLHLKHYAATHKSVFQHIFGSSSSSSASANSASGNGSVTSSSSVGLALDMNLVDKKLNTVIHTLIRRIIHEKNDANVRTMLNLQLMLQCKDVKKNLKNMEGETISALLKKANIKTKEFIATDWNAQWLASVKAQPMKFEADEAQQAQQQQVYEDAKVNA